MTLAIAAPLALEAWALRGGLRTARVLRTGVGPANARRAVDRLRSAPEAALAVAGLCGGVDPDLLPGDVVVASELCADGNVCGLRDADRLVDSLDGIGVSVRVGRIGCRDHVVRGVEREALHASGAIAVDMESAWLAEAAGDRPFCVLRVVLDTPNRELVRPGILADGFRALSMLRRVAPALESWSNTREDH